MVATLEGSSTEPNDGQVSKAPLSTIVTVSGIETELSEGQSANVAEPILVMPFSMVTVLMSFLSCDHGVLSAISYEYIVPLPLTLNVPLDNDQVAFFPH